MSHTGFPFLGRAKRRVRRLHEGFKQTEQIYMVVVAVIIGLLGGISAVGFRLLIRLLNEVAWREGQYTLSYLAALPVWWKVAAPAVGGALVGTITYYFAREARGHGVPEVMEAVALSGGRIRPRVVVAKLFASGVSIASGGSVGREGPIVQIGAALGSTIGQWLRVNEGRLRTLVGCGAAAGIAGTFNAPIAGALFAVEIILGDFGVMQFSPIVISSVAATVVSHQFLGDFPAFLVPTYSLVNPGELFAYAAMGILAGLAAIAFIRALYATEDLFDRIRLHQVAKGVLGGAIVGVIGLWMPHVFGVGYEAINDALNGDMLWYLMLLLVALKIIAVSVTIGSGGSGGIFAPSLFIGAMLGGAIGTMIHGLWPASTAGPGAYALVGMGAVVAAGTHAPITAILIIFELTGEYAIILPLMISCIIATLLAVRLQHSSIYTLKLLRRGIDIHKGKALDVLQNVLVSDQMRTDVVTTEPHTPLVPLLAKFIEHPGTTLFVTGDDREFLGTITTAEVHPVIERATELGSLVIAEDLMVESDVPQVSPDQSLTDVMKFLGHYRGEIPVIDSGRLVGVIWPEDVIARYNNEIFKRDMVQGMASAFRQTENAGVVLADGQSTVTEVHVPREFVGRTIGELNVRREYRLSILMIKRRSHAEDEHITASPGAGYRFQPEDILLVMGSGRALSSFRRLAGASGV
ncbi:MAG: chloride channel protein [Gemmatimonadales bacterium]